MARGYKTLRFRHPHRAVESSDELGRAPDLAFDHIVGRTPDTEDDLRRFRCSHPADDRFIVVCKGVHDDCHRLILSGNSVDIDVSRSHVSSVKSQEFV